MKVIEVFYLIIAGICLVESIINFVNGDTKLGIMFLAGVVFGVSMSFTRRRLRIKTMEKNKSK